MLLVRKLAFDMTEGLQPGTNKVYSVCTYDHAEHASEALHKLIDQLKKSDKKSKILIGTGHAKATCQGAAFEYILNVEKELQKFGVRDKAEIIWISNEYELGDFGMDGMLMDYNGFNMKSKDMVEMIFEDRDIKWIFRCWCNQSRRRIVHYENLDGEYKTRNF